jgi:aspartate carbamoyltransferase regulatory subunit
MLLEQKDKGYALSYKPEELLHDKIKCTNPKCIASVTQEIEHIFKPSNKAENMYRCIYCENEIELK